MDVQNINYGLEGVYFCESKISKVDGVNGRLSYRGYSIEDLAKHSSFEEVCYLILRGKLPTKGEIKSFNKELKSSRKIPKPVLKVIKEMADKSHPMDILRTCVSMLSAYDKDASDNSPEANLRKSTRLISQFATIIAATSRFRAGERYIKPKSSLGHAANFLYMLSGSMPSESSARLLDLMLILHVEHSSNASTFSAIVTASTLSDIYSAVTSGIATLKGSLHGGADEAALMMIRAIGRPENTKSYIEQALAGKQRIMGFGHRIYKTYDPRARIIRQYLLDLESSASSDVRNLTAISLKAEELMIERLGKTKGIWPNIDFFAGPIYTALGIPPELFTPLFAASRVPGWCAHVMEYWQSNRLIRPLENYTGNIDLHYVPIEKRK